MLLSLLILSVLIAIFLTYSRSIVWKDFYIILPEEGAVTEEL